DEAWRTAVAGAGRDTERVGMARGWVVVHRSHARHADPLALFEGVSGFHGCDFVGAGTQRTGSSGVCHGCAGGMGEGQPAGGEVGRCGAGRDRGPGGGGGAKRAAERAETATVFGAERVYAVLRRFSVFRSKF